MAAALILILGCCTIGTWVLNRLRIRLRHPLNVMLVGTAVGLALTSLLLAMLGYVWLPGRIGCMVWLIGYAALTAVGIWTRRTLLLRLITRTPKGFWFGFLILALLPLSSAFSYPVGWDEMVYHLPVPLRWLSDGQATVYGDIPYSALPSGMDYLFMVALGAGGITGAHALKSCIWLLVMLLLYRNLRHALHPSIAFALTLAFAWTDVMLVQALEAYVEIGMIMAAGAMLLHLQCMRGTITGRDGILLGIICGAAMGIKPLAVVLALVAAILAWQYRHLRLNRATARAFIAACTISILAVAIYYGRSWLATGNPVYPFYAGIFTPDNPIAGLVSDYHHGGTTGRFGGTRAIGLAAPVLMPFMRHAFDGSFGWQGLIITILALAAVIFHRKVRVLLIGASVFLLFWAATSQQARFLAMGAFCCWLAAAFGLSMLGKRTRTFLAWGLVGISLLSLWKIDYQRTVHYARASLGLDAVEVHLQRYASPEYLHLADMLYNYVGDDERVGLLQEKRLLYLKPDVLCLLPCWQGMALVPPESFGTGEAIIAEMKRLGLTHLVLGRSPNDVDVFEAYRLRNAAVNRGVLDALKQGLLKEVDSNSVYRLLAITGSGKKDGK